MKRLKLLLAGMSFLSVMVVPVLAHADVNNFKVTSFSADETLSRADPQGELHIVERINVHFTDYNHGILRAIPNSYKNHSLQLHVNRVSSDSAVPTQYTTYGSNGNTVLKIGDPNQTFTGPQEYTIDYTLHNVVSFYKDHDELYWDVNGDQWQQSFEQVNVNLHLPAGLRQTKPPICYAGSYGGNAQTCTIRTTNNTIEAATTQPLLPNQTLTYVAGFQNGYFQPTKWYDTLGEHAAQLAKFFVPFLVIGGGSFIYWWRRGRDPKGTGVIVPQYDPPDSLKPLAVGTIADFKADNRDITATLIDLAVHGYLKIIETKETRTLRKDKLSYSLELTNADFSKLDANETMLLNVIFTQPVIGAKTDVSALKNKLYTTSKTLSTNVSDSLTTDGYFRSNPLKAGTRVSLSAGAAFFVIYFGGMALGIPLVAGFVAGGIIAAICAHFMAARTKKGVEAREHILGLKMYLEVAEKDRIEKLQGPDAQYAANAGEPVKTVDLFEKLLPYAMVLGVEKQWAGKFEGLYTSPPSWYNGNWTTFNAYYLATSLNDGIGSAVNSAFSAPSSSGSSGFGGGGFSGGGGGGGGGGGW